MELTFFAISVREPGYRPSCHNCFHIATDFTFLLAKILLLLCNEMKFARRWIPTIKSQLMWVLYIQNRAQCKLTFWPTYIYIHTHTYTHTHTHTRRLFGKYEPSAHISRASSRLSHCARAVTSSNQLRSHRRHFVKFVLCLCLFLCFKHV